MQRSPLRYFERRIEHAELVDDRHYAMTVMQQFTVPVIGQTPKQKKKDARSELDALLSLGWFVKDRLPDIDVRDEHGAALPFLRRRDQGNIGAVLFLASWEGVFFATISQADEVNARALWEIVQTSVERTITSHRKAAYKVLYRLRRYLRQLGQRRSASAGIRCFALALFAHEEFWLSLETLAEVRLVFTQMRARPGRTYTLTVKYTERVPYRVARSRDDAFEDRHRDPDEPPSVIRRAVRRSLEELGVGSIGVTRLAINLGQAASFWTIFSTPDGTEPVRCFWRGTRTEVLPEDIVSVDVTKAAIGKHHTPGQTAQPDVISLDVQIKPSSPIAGSAVLAILLFLVGAYVYKAMPHLIAEHELLIHKKLIPGKEGDYLTGLVGIGTILAATPATIAGALAYREHTFARRASRGPRMMLAVLSGLAAFLAVVMGLRGPGELAEDLAFCLSTFSLAVAGVFLYIRFGPRWRKNERSRLQYFTKNASPLTCRQRQIQIACITLLFWIAAVLVVARALTVLQGVHVFETDFPWNVSRAWWSWFGL